MASARKNSTPAAYEVLLQYPWPGNVRELKNLIERLVIMSPGLRIEPHHLAARDFPRRLQQPAPAVRKPPGSTLGLRARIRSAEAGRESLEYDARGRRSGSRIAAIFIAR